MRLYDFLPSGNGYRVRLTLHQLDIPFDYREVDILNGETRQAWFLDKNPSGQIPLLEFDDGRLLPESTAILFCVAEGSPLLPDERVARIEVLRWIAFEQSSIDRVISRARFRRLFPDAVPTLEYEFEAWLRDGHHALSVMERHLATRRYFVDDRYTIADIALYAYTHVADEGGFDLDPYPNLRSWHARIRAEPRHVPIDRRF